MVALMAVIAHATAQDLDEKYANEQFEQVIDATGISFSHFLIRLDKIVLPGFVDAHTHV